MTVFGVLCALFIIKFFYENIRKRNKDLNLHFKTDCEYTRDCGKAMCCLYTLHIIKNHYRVPNIHHVVIK